MIALAPEHVSAYALTIERGTAFGALRSRGSAPAPGRRGRGRRVHARARRLAAAGLVPYEVSSYARRGPSRAAQPALLGAGPPTSASGASAASFRPLADGTGWRFANPRATDVYLTQVRNGALAARHVERRSADDLENEAVWLGLRTADGVDRAAHRARYGVDPVAARQAEVDRALRRAAG